MYFMDVNLWAVLVSGLATMAVGFLWYSPLLFAKPWVVLMGYDPNDQAKMAEMRKGAGLSYVCRWARACCRRSCWEKSSQSQPWIPRFMA
jgi:hypothetical protein